MSTKAPGEDEREHVEREPGREPRLDRGEEDPAQRDHRPERRERHRRERRPTESR